MDRGIRLIQALVILMIAGTAAGYGWIMLVRPGDFKEQVYDNPRLVRRIEGYVSEGAISAHEGRVVLDTDKISPRYKYPIRQYIRRKYIRAAGDKVIVDAGVARRANPHLGEARQRMLLRGPILDRAGQPLAWTEIDQYRPERRYKDPRAYAYILGRRDQRFLAGGIEGLLNETMLSPAHPVLYRLRRFFLRPSEGMPVRLTLDAGLQEAIGKALAGKHGAAVVLDPNTFEILAAVSSDAPPLDAPEQQWIEAQDAGGRGALLHRAFDALYPPGSSFKTIVAAAAMEGRVVDPDRATRTPAVYQPLPGAAYTIRDHADSGTRMLDIGQAFAVSSNVYFARLGVQLGFSRIDECARRFGFGRPLSIDLGPGADPWETTPSSLRSEAAAAPAARGGPLSAATLAQISIGQYEVRVTPLQMACVAAAVANGGVLARPRLVADPGGQGRPSRILSTRTARLLQGWMRKVVLEGTARALASRDLPLAGKTGTAEAPGGAPHSWFIGFAPVDHPRIAFAVVIEHGGAGAASAAPLAARIARYWLEAPKR